MIYKLHDCLAYIRTNIIFLTDDAAPRHMETRISVSKQEYGQARLRHSIIEYTLSEVNLANGTLDLEQNRRLPIVEAHDLIELDHTGGVGLGVAPLDGIDKGVNEFGFAGRRESCVQSGVLLQVAPGCDGVLACCVRIELS
jgi:hypothetical protein